MNHKFIYYPAAWFLYLFVSFTLFPTFKITIMLASFPLTTLGGWLYGYPGGIITTLLTIPWHYVMLNYHSDDPAVIHEAFNIVGISCQLIFAMAGAVLKQTHTKSVRLNDSLEDLVHQRTNRLNKLTDYLLELEQMEYTIILGRLLRSPLMQLKSMKVDCTQLKEKTPDSKQVDTLLKAIETCIEKLKSMQVETSIHLSEPASHESFFAEIHQQIIIPQDITYSATFEGHAELKPRQMYHIQHFIQEAVSNALRHANPSCLQLRSISNGACLRIEVVNDGLPFPENPTPGIGLPLMRQRAAKIGADFTIGSLPDGCTRAMYMLPVEAEQPDKRLSEAAANR